jgi:glutathione reductase (NADPH)
LLVIGAGSGGIRAARLASQRGAKVAVVEKSALGGTCVNLGCVPKKLLVYGSHYGQAFKDSVNYGWHSTDLSFNWSILRDNKDREIKRLNGIYQQLLANAGVDLIQGQAQLTGPHQVQVADTAYQAEKILIATGSSPYVPDFPGRQHVVVSDQLFSLAELPKRVLVVGGGYIAVEFAGIFNGLGVATQQLYRGPLFLRGFDDSIRQLLAQRMSQQGVELIFNTEVRQVIQQGAEYLVKLNNGQRLITDLVVYATGRRPNIQGLNLEQLGVAASPEGAIQVDDFYQSSVPSIYALGDVIDRVALTPVALAEATVLVNKLLGDSVSPLDYQTIPTAVFYQPEIGCVGLTEKQAKATGNAIKVYCSEFTPLHDSLTAERPKALIKLIAEADSQRILGAHILGPYAAEIMQGVAVAIKAGATKASFDSTMGIHPTLAEELVSLAEVK